MRKNCYKRMGTLASRPGIKTLLLISAAAWIIPSVNAQLSVSLTPSTPSPSVVGTVVTWTAAVSNLRAATYRYRFVTRGFDRLARVAKDFGPDNTFQWAAGDREGFYTIEVVVRNKDTGESIQASAPYQVLPAVNGAQPVVTPTAHPLVFLYSAPACRPGGKMIVSFVSPDNVVQNTPAKQCDGIFSMNFYIAGLRETATYSVKHRIDNGGGSITEGPVLRFTSGQAPANLPTHTKISDARSPGQGIFLAASLRANFVATDLDGNLIWYYPSLLTFLTRPEAGGYFFGINEDTSGDQSKQIVRAFDLAGNTVFETNAERVNEQLIAMGKPPISAFHHEARRLANGATLVLASVEQILNDVQGDGPVNVLGDMIIVLNRNLEVVWTWNAFDHLDVRRVATLNDKCGPGVCPSLFLTSTANDWLHGNSVSETPDGNLLYSMRSQDWVLKIDFQNGRGTGNIIWRLGNDGDFTIDSSDPNPWFSHQHDPELHADGTLTVFDNGNFRQFLDPSAHSRGQVLRLDEANRSATLLLNVDLGQFSGALGTAQKLGDGHYFFDAGFLSDGTGVSLEVDSSGTTVYGIRSSVQEYRTFRMRDMYTPF